MFDYHIHTSRCGHAEGTMEEYLDAAMDKGLLEIGFADHFPLDLLGVCPQSPVTMRGTELSDYAEDVYKLRKHAAIPVRLGVEIDYFPGKEKETARLAAEYPFDYVIGSIHFLGDWDFTHPGHSHLYKEKNIDLLYEQYFSLVRQMAQSGLYNIAGHLDVIKKFSFFPGTDLKELIDMTCRILKSSDVAVEFNTAGWRAPVGEAYPSDAFLEGCLRHGVPITLGSDAHRPQDVGYGLSRAAARLLRLGFREIATFSAGQRLMRDLG